ncbi:hypothetical protein [Pseudomonas sp. S36]|uniref:hypothetical protein n=1 Tax=Pseudomonas sp. S36 TaxID=2767447 RepID=UPI001914ADD6|nr:hypothetical protein [Pseudomonas sp. S36]
MASSYSLWLVAQSKPRATSCKKNQRRRDIAFSCSLRLAAQSKPQTRSCKKKQRQRGIASSCSLQLAACSSKVGNLLPATDNAQFFHLRIQALTALAVEKRFP